MPSPTSAARRVIDRLPRASTIAWTARRTTASIGGPHDAGREPGIEDRGDRRAVRDGRSGGGGHPADLRTEHSFRGNDTIPKFGRRHAEHDPAGVRPEPNADDGEPARDRHDPGLEHRPLDARTEHGAAARHDLKRHAAVRPDVVPE